MNVALAARAFQRGVNRARAERALSNEVICSGWLLKTPVEKPGDASGDRRRRAQSSKKQRRWFVLRGRTLEYSTDPAKASTPKGSVGITYDTVCAEVDALENVFELTGATVTKGGVEFVGGALVMQVCWV